MENNNAQFQGLSTVELQERERVREMFKQFTALSKSQAYDIVSKQVEELSLDKKELSEALNDAISLLTAFKVGNYWIESDTKEYERLQNIYNKLK